MNHRSGVYNFDFRITPEKLTEMGLSTSFLGRTKTGLFAVLDRFVSVLPTIDTRLEFDDVCVSKVDQCVGSID